ncbi:hypothetical protein SAMN02910447_01232 [Ruminococcus sp. YE71]|uniref:hypothetical protein n=1 Tax=unclassified Ruminococcus TaxID=2608920 RepID=UPI00088DD376|nr:MULTISPECIES: hypothetical protein [unclassified Ruminococcus]SDA17056.1 hypothetical protein SAMN02910446_01232 [Ruminococcus sp. YE78]SFW26007.1 hypothetical protein SAMN02910447_01232 [Ruminococcus sp. YE71]
MFRSVIFTVCMCAVISAAVQLVTPAKMKRELALVCTLLLIASAAAAFRGGISGLPHFESRQTLTAEFERDLLEQTRKSLEDKALSSLHDAGIFPEWLVIDCSLDEYNYVRADKVTVYLSEEQDEAAAERAVRGSVGECEIEVVK